MKGSTRSLRVMAPPPYYMLITHSVSFDITFGVCQHHHNVGSRHLPVVHVRLTSKLKGYYCRHYYNEFLFWREANVIRRYLRRTTFVTQNFSWRILSGRGGLLYFGVNLRVNSRLTVFAQKCTLITSLSEFISVIKQPTSSVVFRPTIHPCHLRTQSQLWVALLWYISASSVC